jgi:hypothetical protein
MELVFSFIPWRLQLRGRQKLAGLTKVNHLRLILDVDIVFRLNEVYNKRLLVLIKEL